MKTKFTLTDLEISLSNRRMAEVIHNSNQTSTELEEAIKIAVLEEVLGFKDTEELDITWGELVSI